MGLHDDVAMRGQETGQVTRQFVGCRAGHVTTQTSRHAIGCFLENVSGIAAQEAHAAKARLAVAIAWSFQVAAVIDKEQSVVNSAASCWTQLHGFDPFILGQVDWKDKRSINVGPAGRNFEWLIKLDDQVGFTQCPIARKLRGRRQVCSVALWTSGCHPSLDVRFLCWAQASITGEVNSSVNRFPWRHIA